MDEKDSEKDGLIMEPIGPDEINVGDYKVSIPSIFDLDKDDDGKFLMPFNPVDYGKDNSIIRQCNECRKELPQGEMKELSMESQFGSGKNQLYEDGIFICRECWFEIYADASNWVA